MDAYTFVHFTCVFGCAPVHLGYMHKIDAIDLYVYVIQPIAIDQIDLCLYIIFALLRNR